jgi:PAS domain S-box-containing protein
VHLNEPGGCSSGEDVFHELQRLAGPAFDALIRSSIAVAVTDPRQVGNPLIFVNAAFVRLSGSSVEELLRDGGQPHDFHTTMQGLGGTASGIHLDIRRTDGVAVLSTFSVTPIIDAAGEVAFLLAAQEESSLQARVTVHDAPAAGGSDDALRLMLSISGAAAGWEWDIGTSLVHGDLRFAQLYGLTPEQASLGVSPKVFYSIIHPKDETRIRLAVGGMLRGAELFSKEYRLLLRDGSLRWVHARGHCQYDGEKPVRFIGALVDITEQKRVQEQLRIAQTAGGIGTFEYVLGYGTVSVSPQFCALLGLRLASDLPVHAINALVLPEEGELIGQQPVESGQTSHVQLRIRRSDTGEMRWLARQGEYLVEQGADPRFSGVIYDITDAKAEENELRRLSAMLKDRVEERTRERDRIWQLSRDLYIVCDSEGRCISVNPAWQNELGLVDGVMEGRPFADFVLAEDRSVLSAAIKRIAAGESLHNLDLRIPAASGQVRSFSWTCIYEEQSIIASGRDVTQRNELEERLRQSQKMEAVGQLTGGIAHDFNNLLMGISGSLELIQLRASQGRYDDLERFISLAQGAAERAAALTHRLLAFSRRQTLAPKVVNPNLLISEMEELISRTVGPEIQVQATLTEDIGPILCDPNQLENALLNLCINARDAMPDGGSLTISTTNSWLDLQEPGESAGTAVPCVTLSVADTGTGMTPDVVARAFDPFFTTKPIGVGTGLGLSMIYGFAKQSGGQVEIDTKLGRGSTIRIHLPRHLASASTPVVEQAVRENHKISKGTVLIVDDEGMVRILVTDYLSELGYTMLAAEDALAALIILNSDVAIDLLITDIGLPNGMNGRQLADAARETRPDLRILFITGYAEASVLRSDDLGGGMHIVKKPFLIDSLADEVWNLLNI